MKLLLLTMLLVFSTTLQAQVEVFQDLPPSRQREAVENVGLLGTEISNSTETEPRQTKDEYDFSTQKFNPEWNVYKKDYLVSIRDHGKDFCLYAGWPSRLKDEKCQHPADLSKESHERKSYSRKDACKGTQVSCNPVIYGFRRNHNGSLFCVESNGTDLVAEKCLKESHSTEEDPTTKDPLDKRLEFLRKQYDQLHPAEANPIFIFLNQGCLCPSAGRMSKETLEKVQKSEACFHVLKTMNNNFCVTDHSPPDIIRVMDGHLDILFKLPASKESIKVQHEALLAEASKDKNIQRHICSENISSTPPPLCHIERSSSGEDSATFKVIWEKEKLPMTLIKWGNNDSETEEATYTAEEIKKGVTVVLKDKRRRLTIECTFEEDSAPSLSEEKKIEISTSVTKKEATTYTIKATVTPESKDAVITWSFKKADGLELKKGWEKKEEPKPKPKPKSSIDLAGMPEGEQDTTPSSPSPREITQTREFKDYEVCAKLTVDGKNYGESCSKIDRKVTVPSNANLKPGGQSQQYIRGTSDTSAVGIK